MFEELFAGTILAVLSSYITHLINVQKTRREIRNIRKAYNLPAIIPFEDKRNTVLLIGIGGVGKTCLINRMLECDSADPREKTKSFKIYWQRVCNGDETKASSDKPRHTVRSPGYWYYICDYCGQNIGSLFQSFIEQQKREYSPIAYGYINSLVLMVDLVAPPPKKGQTLPSGVFDIGIQRVLTNKNEWNKTAIDAIFGLLTQDLKYVCLFINKLDLMSKRSEQALEIYTNAFSNIIDALELRREENDFEFDVIIGSAYKGTGIPQLKNKLKKHSVPSVTKPK